MKRIVVTAVIATLLSVASPLSPGAGAADTLQWPSEREDRLRQVESEVLDVQRQLSVARRHHDTDAVAKLSERFKELQDERVQLLRATGALPQ